MTLTPLEIRNQDFAKAPMGYKRDEVKFFLARAAETVAELVKERDQAARRMESLIKRVSELEARSSAIGEALEMAKKEGQEIIDQAQNKAKSIVDSADNEAQKIINSHAVEINETKQKLYEMTTIKNSYFRKLLRVLELQEDALKKFDQEYEARRINSIVETISKDIRIDKPLQDMQISGNSVHRKRRSGMLNN